ncbi:heme-binding protein [Paralimibaculum aggregatum]|uniref:Heme-binding protein n=1 Tax=Paralimibaculum aggregatum TaxID=3036245 RepID=A0ABQ6LIB4_9RHOB|nr:heme-binding protein [Limibaculum sp. NKW23]GMG81397.1 heme-binding protein [Limibaculum sp. NKW23]
MPRLPADSCALPFPPWLRRLAALPALLLTGACSVFGGTAAEEPPYALLRADPPVEIRSYGAVTVARTVAGGDYDAAVRTGFGRLFDYISGANSGAAEIAMTAPVLTAPAEGAEGTEIAMTAPVLVDRGAEGWAIAFVLPEGTTPETAPRPSDPAVRLGEIPARRVAALRFSGFFTDDAIAEARGRLTAWLEAEGLAHEGDWQAAGYNPPWTLPFLRRNEVLVTLAP